MRVARLARPAVLLGVLALVIGVWTVPRGVRHLYDTFFLRLVAFRVTQGASAPEEITWRLYDFVYLNVRTPLGAAVINDSPQGILFRGLGWCDQSVFVFVNLMAAKGISTRETFIERSHTVAEVLLGGQWRVFDTSYGFVPRNLAGVPATVEEVIREPALLAGSRAKVEWYREARVFLVGGPAGGEQDVSFLTRIRRATVGTALALTPWWVIDRWQDLYLRFPPSAIDDGRSTGGTPESRLFFRARHYYLFQRTAEAQTTYEELLRRYPQGGYADDALYELGLLQLTQRRDASAAIAVLDVLRADHPDSAWIGDATYLEARAHEQAGHCAEAAQLYRRVAHGDSNGLEDARARLARLKCA